MDLPRVVSRDEWLAPDPSAYGELIGPEVLARCTALEVALALIAFHDDFGDLEGWDEGIRSILAS